jgi:hypothetical protein
MNALAGAITSGQYLRGNGTNVVMSSIQAGDVPTLNQNTTGSAATLTTARTIQVNLASTSAASFDGSANITPGVTGDLPFSNLAQGSALSVLGVTGNATADVASIAAGTDHQVLRRSGTSVAFGAVNLAQSDATTGSLPVNRGGTGAATLTANNVILGNGTSAVNFVAPSTSGNVLTSNGTTWTSAAAGGGFNSGTVMLFVQTAAPTGWTKSTTHDNKALRVVSGTASSGGSVAFTTAFASQTPSGSVSINTSGLSVGATTLTTSQIPSHVHDQRRGSSAGSGNPPLFDGRTDRSQQLSGGTTFATGDGGSHTHSISGSATGTFTGNAINLAVQYVDVIIATKD